MEDSDLPRRLAQVPLFARVSDKERQRIARNFRARTFPAGAEIAVEGEEGVGFFLIDSGTARVLRGGEEVRMLGPDDYFGEIALIDGGPRSATVVADTELSCQGMTAWTFRPLVEQSAELAWPLLETLAARLREAEAAGG
jgi:CRP-like cAMP-binding protein